MADTTQVVLYDSMWVEIAGPKTKGYIVNISMHPVLYREAQIQPGDTDTFGCPFRSCDRIDFKLNRGQRMWGRGIFNDARLALTYG